MRPASRFLLTSLSHYLCGIALLLSLALPAAARHKRTAHHRRHAHRAHAHRTAKLPPIVIPSAPEGYETVLRGNATWYGKALQGHHTASGERYDRFQYTCAHRTLPFGTRLRVTNADNGMTVVVRVSDRGPFHNQRILDLSQQAATQLNMIRIGTAGVIAEIVPDDTPLGVAETPENLAALRAADPHPNAPFTAYVLPMVEQSTPAAELAAAPITPAEPLVSAPAVAEPTAVPGSQFVVQAGTFADARQAEAALSRIHSFAPSLAGQLQATVVAGQPAHSVVLDQLDSWLAAETVRRSLLAHGIASRVLTQPIPLPLPTPSTAILSSASEQHTATPQ